MLKRIYQIHIINKIIIVILIVGILPGCNTHHISNEITNITKPEVSNTKDTEIIFSKDDIPEEIKKKMFGVTINHESVMSFDDLAYLTLTYYGYDDKTHTGNMIVDKNLADEVLCIFKEIYESKFPIEKIKLPCEYDGVDELSMQDNNTSAFNDRPIEGTGQLSYHQLGRAIDINPLVNPYYKDGKVLPVTARKYLDRTTNVKGMITKDCICVKIFKKYGWKWGGDWQSLKDYQHFEKIK